MKPEMYLPSRDINRVCAAISAVLLSVASFAQAGSETPMPPKLRLGDDARPSACAVELWVLPEQDYFTGEVVIDVEFERSTAFLWLHGRGLAVTNAWLLQQGRRFSVTPVSGGQEFLGFAFEQPAKRGKAQLHVRYQGAMSDRDLNGLFRRKEADSWYAATQMEATYARRVFPCFDEPGFKVSWRLALHVKRENVAVANTPALSETMEPGGMKCVRFAVSKPLPSYLVAFGVGPFELVDLGKIGRNHTPVRIITTRGRTNETACAAKTIPEILRRLEDYYNIPYPYEKLDHLAIPQFGGAMENAGLIIYGDTTILSPPDRQTIQFERGVASICAHEMAHEWFGDLVTMSWWDDLWLNEAFASWMDPKIVNAWKPEWRLELDQAQAMSYAASADSLVNSRRIRQSIESAPDIENAFDAITYTKGAAVLGMFESWVGPEKFQKGVHAYLLTHTWKNATTADFLKALDRAARSDIASAFSTFLDQPGIPLVSVEARQEPGAAPSLQLSQKRYFPVGSAGETKCTWHIPMRGRYVVGGHAAPFQRLLVNPQETVKFKASQGGIEWAQCNQDCSGYYFVSYRGNLLNQLLEQGFAQCSPAERIGIAGSLGAAVRSADLPLGEALRLQPKLLRDPERRVVTEAASFIGRVREWVPEDLKTNYQRFVRSAIEPIVKGASWESPANEGDDARLQRLALLEVLALAGQDPRLIAQAKDLASAWLANRKAVTPDLVGFVVGIAARNADEALYDRMLAEARKEQDPTDRQVLLVALGSCANPVLAERGLKAVMAKEFQSMDALVLGFCNAGQFETRLFLYDYLKQHYDAIMDALPGEGWGLARLGNGFSDPKMKADLNDFLKDKDARLTGGPRAIAQALESIDLNYAFKMAQQTSLTEFLVQWAASN